MNSDTNPTTWDEAAANHAAPATEPTPAEAVQAVRDARAARGEQAPLDLPADRRDWSMTGPTEGPHYPQADTYQFGAFAGAVIELGGYSDIEMIDPYTGRRLWLGQALGRFGIREGETETSVNIYDAMRALVDLAEATGFLGTTARTHPDHANPDETVG